MEDKGQIEPAEPIEQAQRYPYEQSLEFALKATIGNLIFIFFLRIMILGRVDFATGAQFQIADGLIRALCAAIAMHSLGRIIAANGFKFSFVAKGFQKGMIAHMPLLLCILTLPVLILSLPEATLNIENALTSLVPRAIFDIGNAVWEEVLWRGVLMTGFLVKWEYSWDERSTIKKRIALMLICSAAFGLIHFGGGWLHVMFAAVLGTIFGSAYIYSRNLLACSVAHFLVNYIAHIVITMFSCDIESVLAYIGRFYIINIILGIVIIIPIAIYITIKAEPFKLEDIVQTTQKSHNPNS